MKKIVLAAALGFVLIGCGDEMKEAQQAMEGAGQAMEAAKQISNAAENMETSQNEAEQLRKERIAKGDTVAMPADELAKFLPTSIDGYKPYEEPSKNTSSMPGFSLSTVEQTWVSTGGDTNQPSRIKVTLSDYGANEAAWGMYQMLGMAWNMSSEDAHRRSRTAKLDVPYSGGFEEYNKDSKDATFTATTRYRYLVQVIASEQKDDQSEFIKNLGVDLVKKFEGK